MIYLAFVTALIASVALHLRDRSYRGLVAAGVHLDVSQQRRWLIVRGFREFAVPLAISTGVFTVLDLWVHATAGVVNSATTVRSIEHAILTIRKTYIKPLVLSKGTQFWIIASILALGFVWPFVRSSEWLAKYRRATLWITRAYLTATLVASFTFFGSVHAVHAQDAEVHLRSEIDEIDRHYDDAFTAVADAVTDYAAAQAAVDPAQADARASAASAFRDEAQAHREINASREEVAREPNSDLRDFKLTVDTENRPASAPPPQPVAHRVISRAEHDSWTLAEGKALEREATEFQREEHAAVAITKELTEAAVDVAHEELARHLLASLFAGTPIEGLTEVALDSEVLYDFRDVATRAAGAFADRVVRQHKAARLAFTEVKANVRSAVISKATTAAARVRTKLATGASAARDVLNRAVTLHRQTKDEYQRAAGDQFNREATALRSEALTTLSSSTQLRAAADRLFDRLLPPANLSGMTRVARLRELGKNLNVGEPEALLASLTDEERKLGGDTPLSDAVNARTEAFLLEEESSKWGELRAFAYKKYRTGDVYDPKPAETLQMLMAWNRAKRQHALSLVAQGKESVTPAEWEQFFHAYCKKNNDMAVMWGWFVKSQYHDEIAGRYHVSNVVPQHGYRYYLEETGFGGAGDASSLFASTIAQATVGGHCNAQ